MIWFILPVATLVQAVPLLENGFYFKFLGTDEKLAFEVSNADNSKNQEEKNYYNNHI